MNKKIIGKLLFVLAIVACALTQNVAAQSKNESIAEPSESLNDIRFEKFKTNQDWIENDYIRALRSHLDAFNANEVEIPVLNDFREIAKSQFVIMQTEPFLLGGLFIYFSFLEDPSIVFTVAVYSDVDEKTRIVSNYKVMEVIELEQRTSFTKERILELAKEHPDYKLW